MNWTPALIVFVISVGMIVYTYLLFPLLLALVPRRRGESPTEPKEWPTVSVLVSVYNEEKHIAERIENLLGADYPPEKLQILIGSDGSTDKTNEIVQRYSDPRLKLHAFTPREGKPSVLNHLQKEATGEILVFTDANTMFERDAVKKLVRHFSDAKIGGVCGRLIFHGVESETNEGAYWKLETYLKERESAVDSCLGANGGIYAIRHAAWVGIPDNTLVDDFVIAMRVREQGLRVIYDRDAVATEEMPTSIGHEMTRRIRIGAGGFQAMILCWPSLLPWKGFYSFAFWSHKVVRWLVPFFMIAALVSNVLLLPHPFWVGVLALQLAFYALALAGAFVHGKKILPLSIPQYFVTLNFALLVGFFRFVTGTQRAAWKRTAR